MFKRICCCFFAFMLLVVSGCSEKEKTQSAETVLKESNKDSDGAKKVFFELPENFTEDGSVDGMYVPLNQKDDDFACIYYRQMTYDERYEFLTEHTIQSLMQEMYKELYGIDTSVDVLEFFRFQLKEHKAFKIRTEIPLDDMVIDSNEYLIILDDECVSVSYVTDKDSKWKTAFENSASTLDVKE